MIARSVRMFLTALAIANAFSDSAHAQRFTGRVIEEPSGSRIAFAELTLVSPDGMAIRSVTSDSAGFFVLPGENGFYRIRAIRLGYAPFLSEPLELKRGEVVSLVVRLAARGIRLPPLEVNARTGAERGRDGFERRQALGKGWFLTLDSIRDRKPIITSDLFDGIPAVMVHEGFGPIQIYSMRGSKCFILYVDHMPRGQLAGTMPDPRHPPPRGSSGSSENAVNNLKVEWIRGIEIYRDLSEVPRELRTSNRMFDLWPAGGIVSGGRTQIQPCGMIWIWTEIGW